MKFQCEEEYPLKTPIEISKLKRLLAVKLMYDFINNVPDDQFNDIFNFEELNPTDENIKDALKMHDMPKFYLLKSLKQREVFTLHVHINL